MRLLKWNCAAASAFSACLGISPIAMAADTQATGSPSPEPVEHGEAAKPAWLSMSSPDAMAKYYPRPAELAGVGGRVVVQCAVSALGSLENCTIVSETPKGFGFGEASRLFVTQRVRMKPKMVDGKPVGGGEVIIPVVWNPPP